MLITLWEITKIKTWRLDANAKIEGWKYPFFTCSKEIFRIDTPSYDCECVLIAGNGDLNVKYYKGKFDAYQRTYIIESNWTADIEIKYLYYFMDQYMETLRSQTIGWVIQYIKMNNLTDIQLPLPALHIQRAIADKLDKLQSLIDLKKEAIVKTDGLAKAIFLEMFGDPINNEKGREVKKLKEIWKLASWWTPSRWTPDFFTWTIPWITTVSLWKTFISKDNAVEYITEDAIKNSATKLIPKNSILIWTRVWVWKVSINIDDLCYNQDITWITEIDKNINLLFFREFLSYKSESYNDVKRWATIQWITSDVIKNTNIYIPPLPLQQKFADIITKIEVQKNEHKNALAELEELYQVTMQESFKL